MSGFSAKWLALREPADRAARNGALAARLADTMAAHDPVRVTDLGAGTGSNLRATSAHLGPRQDWTLLDHDEGLLRAACAELSAWAELAEDDGEWLVLHKAGRRIRVACRTGDLAAQPDLARLGSPHLVTASAFFDLASADWIGRFADQVAEAGACFYTVLTCDGADEWTPPHPLDAAIAAAFRTHQGRDKGFGPAAGNGASQALASAFRAAGYEVDLAPSPWRLSAGDPLIPALAEGTAGAAIEAGMVSREETRQWAEARAQAGCVIGHLDLLAIPSGFRIPGG
ncbi:SAM-dependent methyltransferase [Aquabacter sp. L1I39]|uniref:SAM-dependent methyltransferase n=1 Tax=Aquabacter sp. L1I39 TaxID=2820278 RepID=UPI001ADA4C0C|nr:SAM-dependent methyltransferase [Aquabacter sp. L1I39]QTL01957.1 SAM-dependent methyltransferase [Aquabacter sp. L1I39]